MKPTIQNLQDSFKIGYEAYEESRKEANAIWDYFHNRQYTDAQLAVLDNRGQPAETFNVIKLFTRMMLGYYSTSINTVQVNPVGPEDITTSAVLNDITQYILRRNSFIIEGEKVKLSGIISGLMCSYIEVIPTGRKDQFGRPINTLSVEHIPDSEIVLDPQSKKDDYSDAEWIHRFRWIGEEKVEQLFGKAAVKKLEEYYNHLNIEEAEFTYLHNDQFVGYYAIFNNYLIVHTIVKEVDGRSWSVHWCGDVILHKKEITHREVKFPYQVKKLHTSDKTEYYGVFREVYQSQRAINQALLKVQLMVNTKRIYVEDAAVENIDDFRASVERVNSVVEVLDLSGIKIDDLSREVLDQYTIIDKAFDRVQRILGINDSFLGMAFASDSGRKVKLQQQASIVALRYISSAFEAYYQKLGWDIINLVKQYFTATQVLRIADDATGERWVAINQPMQVFSGQMDPNTNEPIMEYIYEEVLDPATGEPMIDDGNYIIAPVPEEETEIAFTDVDIEVSTAAYNDEDERSQLMLETMLSGTIGQMLAQVNPAGFFDAAALNIKNMKTRHSPDIGQILKNTADMLRGTPGGEEEASAIAQGNTGGQPGSQSLKLPQNTNEG